MAYAAYIFDLDGTLLDTLPDLVRLTNMVLAEHGWPERTRDEIHSFVGDGGRALMRRAAPPAAPDSQVETAFNRWRALYPTYGHAFTEPYPGVPELLSHLKAGGAKLGVLSNKFDDAVREVIGDHFPGVFAIARGECDEIPRKPDPRGLQFIMSRLDVAPEQVLYVGDSPTDLQTARNAGTNFAAVAWGYHTAEELREAGAPFVATAPSALAEGRDT